MADMMSKTDALKTGLDQLLRKAESKDGRRTVQGHSPSTRRRFHAVRFPAPPGGAAETVIYDVSQPSGSGADVEEIPSDTVWER